MKIALHSPDNTGYMNYALMKISAWHKAMGDRVEWFNALESRCVGYDRVYSSKVFTFTQSDDYLPDGTVYGGTGYGLYDDLPNEIDDMYPDYSIYPGSDHAIGFLTRGCPNKCAWCCVPKKEGGIRAYRKWGEVARKDSDRIVFMDNNVLASDHGLAQIEELGHTRYKIDFNQGLDARLITPEIGRILGKCKWNPYLRLACDTKAQMPFVESAHENLIRGGVGKSKFFCYVLVKDVDDAYERVMFLRGLGIDPFAQPYRDFENNIEPTQEQRDFSRWVNHKAIFKSVAWENYKA